MIRDLDKDEQGNFILHPLVAFSVDPTEALVAALTVVYATSQQEMDAALAGSPGAPHFQLSLTPSACRNLARELVSVADRLERRPAGLPS